MALSFDKISGTTGRYDSELTIVISGNSKKVKKYLTATNKAVQHQIRRHKQLVEKAEAKIAAYKQMNITPEAPVYSDALAAIDNNNKIIAELIPQAKECYYEELSNGDLRVPAGFWYLCETIDGSHLSKDVKPFYLDGLRPYQVEALEAAYKYKRSTIVLATGLGKSKIAISLAMAGVQSGKRVMIVVPTEYLVDQMYKELREIHPNTTAIGGEYKHAKLGWDIMVITIHSAHKYMDEAEVLIVDEGHHSAATTWNDLHISAKNVTHVYNLTATPMRGDGLDIGIHAFGGPVVINRDAKWGIDNGWLSKLRVIQIRTRALKEDKSPMYYHGGILATTAYKKLMLAPNIVAALRDRILAGLEKGHKIMCIFKTVKGAEAFRKLVKDKLLFQVAHADKKLSKNPKWPLIQFQKGESNLLVACDKLVSEGINIPNSTLLICATQHSSDVTTYQLAGRVLRKAEGKELAIIIDFVTMGYGQFERAADKRLNVYRHLTEDVKVVEL